MNLEKELAKLQDAFAMVDLFVRRTRDTAEMEILVKKLQSIRIRMDGNQNHKRPHVHIDYGNKYHAASYAIDTGERLVGDLDNNLRPRSETVDRRIQAESVAGVEPDSSWTKCRRDCLRVAGGKLMPTTRAAISAAAFTRLVLKAIIGGHQT
jgi:hypothetical protein